MKKNEKTKEKNNSILLIIEVSDHEEIPEMFRDKVPFFFEDQKTAIDAFYYMKKNADKYIHAAQFLQQ